MKFLGALVPLGAVGAVLSGIALRSGDGESTTTTNQILIRPRDGGCVVKAMEGPEMTEVREVLLPQLTLEGTDEAITARVRKALLERYGDRLTERATPMGYMWKWNPVTERWEWVCGGVAEFEVDFGESGSVVVDSEDAELAPASAAGRADLSGLGFRSDAHDSNRISLRPKDGGCVVKAMAGPEMTEVRELLSPRLESPRTDEALTASVRKELLERYGSRVTERAAPPHYMWVLIDGEWVLVCTTSASEFEVDFGECGSVVVAASDAEPMRTRAD